MSDNSTVIELDHDAIQRHQVLTQIHDGREYLLEPVESFLPRVRYERDVQELFKQHRIPWPFLVHDTYSLAAYQTAVHDQGGRGSCTRSPPLLRSRHNTNGSMVSSWICRSSTRST